LTWTGIISLKVIFVLFVARIWKILYAAIIMKMLDAGFWIPDIIKVSIFFIQHQASSIQYLRHSVINVCFQDFVFFGSGLSGFWSSQEQKK
jgi:hypothetical protein